MKLYSYLALGDSYTIGEQVNLGQSFSYQAIQLLRSQGYNFLAPEIVATTGWTTDELKAAIDSRTLLPAYDFVSLLIGVNNQYRGKDPEQFRTHFRTLLETAVKLAGEISANVIVLSIPDWGVTPFAKDRDTNNIAEEIDLYNIICKVESAYFQTRFIDITPAQRMDGNKTDFLAADMLHPSGKEYAKWAVKLSEEIIDVIEQKA